MAIENEGARALASWMARTETTHRALADAIGAEQPTVTRWLGGHARPAPHLRRAVAALTGIPEYAWETPEERAAVARAEDIAASQAACTGAPDTESAVSGAEDAA